MQKIIFVILILVSVTTFGINPGQARATSMNVSELVELLISIGAISTDKIEAARKVAISLDKTTIPVDTLPYLQVLKPNGGESLEMDLDIPYSFSWGASAEVPVQISLVSPKGAICNLTSSPVMSKRLSTSINVLLKSARCYDQIKNTSTALTDGTYKMRVTYAGPKLATTTAIKDDSDNTFTIKPAPSPKITVTYPNGGERLTRGDTYDIKYTVKDTTDKEIIYASLINADGYVIKNMHRYGKSGSIEFELDSTTEEGLYKIGLKTLADDKTEIQDYSDTYFWIARRDF